MPLIGNTGHVNYSRMSDFWFTNVKYMKLRNLELGYTLPKQWTNFVKIQSLRLYVAAQNLFTITNKPGFDPEATTESGLQYPTNRIINIGFNLKL